eukprot:306428_1
MLCLSIFIVMTIFMLIHSVLLFSNRTTVEMITNPFKMRKRKIELLREIKCIYDLGSIKKNIQQVFGEKWYLALLPMKTKPMGNGKIFPLQQHIKDIIYSETGCSQIQQSLL